MEPRRFSPAVLARLREPRAAGRWPPGASGVTTGEAGDEDAGILVRIHVQRVPRTSEICEARFQAFGCPAAIACASWVAEWMAGKTSASAAGLTATEIAQALALGPGDLPTAELALRALGAALAGPGAAPRE